MAITNTGGGGGGTCSYGYVTSSGTYTSGTSTYLEINSSKPEKPKGVVSHLRMRVDPWLSQGRQAIKSGRIS